MMTVQRLFEVAADIYSEPRHSHLDVHGVRDWLSVYGLKISTATIYKISKGTDRTFHVTRTANPFKIKVSCLY